MDKAISMISEYAVEENFAALPPLVVTAASARLLDSIGCAVGGFNSPQAQVARAFATPAAPDAAAAARLLGSHFRTSLEHAAFANTCMIRNLDFNDFYPASHPSDMIGGLLAVADSAPVSGERLLGALVVAYEVAARVSDASHMREKGWDQGYAIGLGTVAGIGNLLGCDRQTIADALAITATANVPLRATRAGQLSLWKGGATAYAVRNGVFGIELARYGMSGPESPIEGRHGLWEQVSGEFAFPPLPPAEDYRVLRSTLKFWPVEFNAQATVWAALELRERFALEDLKEVEIGTYWSSWHEIGSEPAKWDPQTRETADHSMPYIFVKAMKDGKVDLNTFDRACYLDPDIRPEMAKVSVGVDDECDAAWPDSVLLKLTAKTNDGMEHRIRIENPKGFWANPMSPEQLADKFRQLVEPVLGSAAAAKALDVWSAPRSLDDVGRGLDAIERPSGT